MANSVLGQYINHSQSEAANSFWLFAMSNLTCFVKYKGVFSPSLIFWRSTVFQLLIFVIMLFHRFIFTAPVTAIL